MEKKYIAPELEIVRIDAGNVLLKLSGEGDDIEKVGNAPEFDFEKMFGI